MRCVDASKDGKRFIDRADDILTAFLELEMAIASTSRITLDLCPDPSTLSKDSHEN